MSKDKLKIAIAGMSGFVGSHLSKYLSDTSDIIGIKVRQDTSLDDLTNLLNGVDVLINLSGTSILARWSDKYKKSLYSSRIDITKKLVEAVALCDEKPKLFISTSAIGIYSSNMSHNDESKMYANDFLSKLCQKWEDEAKKIELLGVRCVQTRFGVVYGKDGGAMAKMLTPFKLGLGGKLSSGDQMISWIHINDLVKAVKFIIDKEEIRGSINFTSPSPISNIDQTYYLAKALSRPALLTIPDFIIKLIFGEGSTVMLDSKEVYPSKLLENDFVFKYNSFNEVLNDIVGE